LIRVVYKHIINGSLIVTGFVRLHISHITTTFYGFKYKKEKKLGLFNN